MAEAKRQSSAWMEEQKRYMGVARGNPGERRMRRKRRIRGGWRYATQEHCNSAFTQVSRIVMSGCNRPRIEMRCVICL